MNIITEKGPIVQSQEQIIPAEFEGAGQDYKVPNLDTNPLVLPLSAEDQKRIFEGMMIS